MSPNVDVSLNAEVMDYPRFMEIVRKRQPPPFRPATVKPRRALIVVEKASVEKPEDPDDPGGAAEEASAKMAAEDAYNESRDADLNAQIAEETAEKIEEADSPFNQDPRMAGVEE